MYFKEHKDLYKCKIPIDERVAGPNEKYQMRRNKYPRRFRAYFVWNFSRYVYGRIREWSPQGSGTWCGSTISRNLLASSSSSNNRARGSRFADSHRTRTVLDVITREITGFERAPYLTSTSIHPSFSIHHHHPTRVAISVTPTTLRHSLYDVRRTFEASLSLSTPSSNSPVTLKGESQLSYPICPYFS